MSIDKMTIFKHSGKLQHVSVYSIAPPPPPPSSVQASSSAPQTPASSIAALGDAAAALQLTFSAAGHAPHTTPTSMHSYFSGHTHQDYLNRLHASAALAADQHALDANLRASLNRNSRKRALSASPGYAEIDLANLIRHSPTSLQLLNAAATANGGSPSSSGSYGQLSGTSVY